MTRADKIDFLLKNWLNQEALEILQVLVRNFGIDYKDIGTDEKSVIISILDWDDAVMYRNVEKNASTIINSGEDDESKIGIFCQNIWQCYRSLLEKSELALDEIYWQEFDEYQFFSQENSDLKIEFWSLIDNWTAEEATAIVLNKNPNVVSMRRMKAFQKTGSPFARRYFEILGIFRRASKGESEISQEKYKSLAKTLGLLNHSQSAQQKIHPTLPEGSKVLVHHKTKHSFYKILLGFAVIYYDIDHKYDPKNKEGTFQDMADDLAALKLEVDAKTLRTHFKAALEWARSRRLHPAMSKKIENEVLMRKNARQLRARSENTEG